MTRPAAAPMVHLAASGGGHLDVLRCVADGIPMRRRTWLTVPGRSADSLRTMGERVLEVPAFDLRHRDATNITRSMRHLVRERPRAVITSGAGVMATFCIGARATGARVLFIETMARVSDSSLSGRLLSRLAERSLVQWPEMAAVHPRTTVCRPALLEGLRPEVPPAGDGTFVALGTHHQPFDRLLRAVADAVRRGILPGPVRGQIGETGPGLLDGVAADVRPWLSPDEMRDGVRRAAFVVCHAGSGIVASTLQQGRRPLVFSRLAACGEHVDDHQRQLAAKLAQLGLAVHVEDGIRPEDIAATATPLTMPSWPADMLSIAGAVRDFVGV